MPRGSQMVLRARKSLVFSLASLVSSPRQSWLGLARVKLSSFLWRKKTGCRRRNVNKEDIFLLVVMGSNPGELLGAQDGRPSFSSSVSSSFSCLTKFFLKLVLGRITWQLLFQDRRGGPSNFPWLTGRGMQMFPKRWILWQSRNEILRSIPQWYFESQLNSIGWSSYFNEKPRLVSSRFGPSGWLVSNNRQRLTRMRTERISRRCTTLWVRHWWHYFNDWLGWFYPGYSGFHPQKKIWYKKRTKEKENLTLF